MKKNEESYLHETQDNKGCIGKIAKYTKASDVYRGRTSIGGLLKTVKDALLWQKLLICGLILVPYDAVRIMPSNYRPISIAPFMLLLVALVCDGKARQRVQFSKASFALFVFAGAYTVSSLFRVFKGDIGVTSLFSEGAVLLIGVISFTSVFWALRLRVLDLGVEGTVSETIAILGYAYIVPLAVGVLEALSMYGVVSIEVKQALMAIFGGNQSNRLCVTSFEASWASIHLLIAFACHFYLSFYNRRWLIGCLVSIILFFISQSAQGMICACLSALSTLIYISIRKKKIKSLVIGLMMIAAAIGTIWVYARISYTNGNTSYYIARIANFISVERLIATDASAFVRILFPLFGLLLFFESPIFGYGAGGFERLIPEYLRENYAWAREFEEIRRYMNGELTPSATCLYTKVLEETGLIGGIPFYYFLISEIRNAFKTVTLCKFDAPIMLLVSIVFFNLLQFASYAYMPLWIVLALCEASNVDLSQRKTENLG